MSPTPRRWARRVGCASSVGLAVLALGAAGGAAASAAESTCGMVALHLRGVGPSSYWSLNRVRASGVSCTAARGLVRSWAVAAGEGRIPGRVIFGGVDARGVIVYGRFGPPYGFDGYTCRWASVNPGSHAGFLPGAGRCSSGGGVVSWSYRGETNPTLGPVRGCAGTVAHGPAVATTIRARTVTCVGAKRMIRYLLAHGVIRSGQRWPRLVRTHALGFRLTQQQAEFRARRGRSWFSFYLYWYLCGC